MGLAWSSGDVRTLAPNSGTGKSANGVPTVVIHGTEDPVLPYPHGLALARTIPGARLLPLHRSGHELHQADWETIAAAVP